MTYGGSHQIFHVMVILAGLVHMEGLLRALDHLLVRLPYMVQCW